jgi:hypothetical protein
MSTSINNLPTASPLSLSDLMVLWSSANSGNAKASLSAVLTLFKASFVSPDFTTMIVAPTVSGFNQQIGEVSTNTWLIINPTGAFAAGTVTLPPLASCFDGQQILVTTSNSIAALTVTGNGSDVVGEPSSLGVGGFFALRFNLLQEAWYCVAASVGTFDDITITGDILDEDGQVILAFEPNTGGAPVDGNVVISNGDGASAEISVQGTSDNVDLNITAKNEGDIRISTQGTGNIDLSPGGDDVASVDGDEIVTRTATQTLTNKTLTTPVLTKPSADAVVFSIGALALLQAVFPPASNPGLRAIINDSNATLAAGIGNAAANGGANVVPVFSDGTDYIIG